MGLRTDIEHSVRLALQSTGKEYYGRLSSMLDDARRLGLVRGGAVDLSLDHWHIPYWGEKLIDRYGYHYNGMMGRSFPGVHPLTAYDLTNGCFILITPPPSGTSPTDVTGIEGLSLCEGLGLPGRQREGRQRIEHHRVRQGCLAGRRRSGRDHIPRGQGELHPKCTPGEGAGSRTRRLARGPASEETSITMG
jgi:hypothetical protein